MGLTCSLYMRKLCYSLGWFKVVVGNQDSIIQTILTQERQEGRKKYHLILISNANINTGQNHGIPIGGKL